MKKVNNNYEPKNFVTEEFVPKHIYERYGDISLSIFMDTRIIITADQIRKYFNRKMYINNYFFGGIRNFSGYRDNRSYVYNESSAHSFGRAIDFIISDLTADEIREEIIKKHKKFPFISRMELGTSWIHVDCQNSQFWRNRKKFKNCFRNGIFLF